jgi:phosphoglucomutase
VSVDADVSPLAGTLPDESALIDVDRLRDAYFDRPDPEVPEQRVAFGTSGHRGTSLERSFNEAHVLAVAEAICRYRAEQGVDGPLFLGRDTHALSELAAATVVEVLSAHGVPIMADAGGGYTPTPAVSHAILTHNRGGSAGVADGIIVTPSHNPPEDGGLKYNPPHGGPAGTDVTGPIEELANELLANDLRDVQRGGSGETVPYDYVSAYVEDLGSVVDMDAIRGSGLRLAVDPLGGASVRYWAAIAERYALDLTLTSEDVDPTFRFVPIDADGKIRMDCSSPYAMAELARLADRFDLAFGNDPDADRHGVVVPGLGLFPPNHHLATCVSYVFDGNRDWAPGTAVAKAVGATALIDRIAAARGIRLIETPVGFKWFVDGLLAGEVGIAGEESAGTSFLRRSGEPWTTDKDGLIPCLLAAEMTARTGKNPAELYAALAEEHGRPEYRRVDVPASPAQKRVLKGLSAEQVRASELAGEPIESIVTDAPGNGQPIGGVKVSAANAWFAARPSGTENVYKIYAESFHGADHLEDVIAEAQTVVDAALEGAD